MSQTGGDERLEDNNIELTVVVPTYNEAENIGALIDRLVETLDREGPPTYEVLVVDDNSPDGTCLIVREKAMEYPGKVRCLLRKRGRGLATAIMRGIYWARGRYVIVMDADFQHPPEVVPKLYWKAVNTGADIVVASRYRPGGGVEGWSRMRRLMSKTANLIARILVPNTRKVTDPMSGFFLVRKDIVNLSDLRPRGYKILMEIIAKTYGAQIEEVAYTFRNRAGGKSKLGLKTIIDFLLHAISLSPLVKFSLVGLLGALINLGVMSGILITGAPLDVASILGIESGLLFNFVLHEAWTFQTKMRGGWKSRLIGYHLASSGGMITNYLVMKALTLVGIATALTGQAAGIIAGFGVNYALSQSKVWGVDVIERVKAGEIRKTGRTDKRMH